MAPTTIRLGEDLEQWLLANSSMSSTQESLGRRVKTELQIWKSIQAAELSLLRLTLNELGLIADVLNGTIITDIIVSSPPLVAAEILDARRLNPGEYGKKWSVDEMALIDKLSRLGPTADYALAHAVTRWWVADPKHTKEGWKNVGVNVYDSKKADPSKEKRIK